MTLVAGAPAPTAVEGLSSAQAAARLNAVGPNRLAASKHRPAWRGLLDQFRNPLIAVLLGAALLSLADTLGRTVIAPAQLPAGLAVAMLGAPYFVFLLWRSRS